MIEKQQHKIDWNFKRKCDNNDQNKKNAYQKGKNYKIEFQDYLILKDEIEKKNDKTKHLESTRTSIINSQLRSWGRANEWSKINIVNKSKFDKRIENKN
jgi:hypothetical protein